MSVLFYKDYPLCHALAAGHYAENSVPFDAFNFIALHRVPVGQEIIWKNAEQALAKVVVQAQLEGKIKQVCLLIERGSMLKVEPSEEITRFLFQKGYDSATGDMAEDGDYVNIDKKLGIDDPAIVLFADSLY